MAARLMRHAVFVIAAVASALLMLGGIEEKSPTEDEWAHLVRGLQFWHGEDSRLHYAHPPAANAITALPLALDGDVPDFTTLRGWETATVGTIAYAYIKADYSEARAKLMRARRASIGLGLVGLLYAYLWGSAVLGPREGLVLALLLAFQPTILGLARYVSSDVACGVWCFVATGELARHLRGRAPGASWFGVPAALSLAVLSKHSAILLLPIFVFITLTMAIAGLGRYRHLRSRGRIGSWVLHTVFCAVVVVFAINAAYGFAGSGLAVADLLARPEPQYWVSERSAGLMLEEHSPLGKLPRELRVPLPYTWLYGVSAVGVQNVRGYPWASFFGASNTRGHFAFFPVMLALKSSALVLLGILGSAVAFRRRSASLAPVVVVGVVGLCFLLIASGSRLNMGVRHILPVLYLSTVWAATGLCAVWDMAGGPRRRAAGLVVASSLLLAPALVHRADYLGYFNIGRTHGHRVSVVGEDVGQDRYRFSRWVEEEDIAPLFYDSQSQTRSLEARWAGMRFHELECGTWIPPGAYAAVHVSRRFHIGSDCFSQLARIKPITTFNDHIEVYRIPVGGPGAPWSSLVADPL